MESNLSHITDPSFINDVKKIVEQGRRTAYGAVNAVMIETYWRIGRRIVEQEQNGKERAEYGKQLIEMLSAELTLSYGKGFSGRYLRAFRQFYLVVPDIEIWKSRFPNTNSIFPLKRSCAAKSSNRKSYIDYSIMN
jgi:hypothetical protein